MSIKENKKMEIFIIAICFCLLLPILFVSIYNRPAADDYDYSRRAYHAIANGGNFWDLLVAALATVRSFYLSWQGTYMSAFVMAFQPGIWGARAYALATPVIIGTCFVCLVATVHILNRRVLQKSFLYSTAVASVLITVLVLWVPYPREAWFWYNGAMHYIPWFFVTLLNLAVLLFAGDNLHRRSGKFALFISTVLSFLLSGVNQSSAFGNILLVLVFVVYWLFYKRYFPLLPFLFAVLGFIIMFVAPGNAVRQAHFQRQGVLGTMWATVKYVVPLFSDWISIKWVLSIVLVTPFVLDFAARQAIHVTKWTVFFSIGISFAVLCGMLCVPYMAMGNFGPGRLTNMIWVAFMFFSWINYFLFFRYLVDQKIILLHENLKNVAIHGKVASAVVICLLLLCFLPDHSKASTSSVALKELSGGIPQQHAEEMDWRYGAFFDDSLYEVGVYPITVKSKLIGHTEISTDPNVWPNTALGKYYGKSIYLIKVPE